MMDMHTVNYPYAAPEFHMGFAALADLGHFYRMPVWGLSGASDSKVVDAQAGAEASYQLLLAQLSGSNLVHDVGYINGGLTSSMEMLLLCDEIISLVRHVGRGIQISDETLALDVIHEVGPTHHFLEHDHTVRHCREAWCPRFFDRRQLELWQADGSKDLTTVLREKVREILATHKVPELPENIKTRIRDILNRLPRR
ncbi:MAG: trimethylamine methyltransferase family protein [Kiritimatiellae bacterium]|nr:trimethylamine methyltransferase family protein [Kiritimatiellia bacterium]